MIEASTCLEMEMHNRLKTPVGDQERLERLLSVLCWKIPVCRVK